MNIILVNYRLYTIVNVVELLLYKYSVMTCRLTSVHIEVYLSVVQYNEGGGGGYRWVRRFFDAFAFADCFRSRWKFFKSRRKLIHRDGCGHWGVRFSEFLGKVNSVAS